MQACSRSAPNRLDHSRGALAHSVSPSAWRRAFEVRNADATIAPALRVGAATALVLVAGGLLGYRELAGFAALGALTSAFGRHEPYPVLARKVGLVGIALIGCVAAGALLGASGLSPWAQIAFISVGAGVAAWLLAAFKIAGPGPVILIFAATAATGYVKELSDLGPAVAAITGGVLVGWVAALVPYLFVPMGPARLAVARALAVVGQLERDHAEPAIVNARAAIDQAREVISHSGPSGGDHYRQLLGLLSAAESVVEKWAHDRDPDRLRFIVDHANELRKIRRSSEIRGVEAEAAPLPEPVGFFGSGLRRLRSREGIVNGARIVVAATLAGWFCVAVGFEHPLWASMGAMAAMQGFSFSQTVQRGIQRLLGNVAGAVLAAILIAAALGYWQTVIVIIVLQIVTELVVIRNYGYATIAITPTALLLTGLGSGITPTIALSRVLDTLVGVVVGILVAAVAISRADHHHLR